MLDFWDEVFPSLHYAFISSLEIIDEYGYDSNRAIKQCQLYSRTEEILQKIVRDL